MAEAGEIELVPVLSDWTAEEPQEVLLPLENFPVDSAADDLFEFVSAAETARNDALRGLLSEVNVGAAVRLAREAAARPDRLYRLVEGGVTPVKGAPHLVRGAQWASGAEGSGLKKMALFREVGSTAALASAFFSQGLLVYVATELNRLRTDLEGLRADLFQAEVSRMKGCVRFAGTALRHYGLHWEKALLFNAIQSLETEVDPLLDAVMRRVRARPAQASAWGNGAERLEASYEEVFGAVIWLLKGMSVLAVLYSVTDPDFGRRELDRLLRDFHGRWRDVGRWLSLAGRALAEKGYGSDPRERIVSLDRTVSDQVAMLRAPRRGLLIEGRRLAALLSPVAAGADARVDPST